MKWKKTNTKTVKFETDKLVINMFEGSVNFQFSVIRCNLTSGNKTFQQIGPMVVQSLQTRIWNGTRLVQPDDFEILTCLKVPLNYSCGNQKFLSIFN